MYPGLSVEQLRRIYPDKEVITDAGPDCYFPSDERNRLISNPIDPDTVT